MREDCIECTFEDLLDYEQPTKYIVRSTKYSDDYKTPVLTAGKSFIKGYTNETDGIFDELPTIIFDDFTTATQFVDFAFKVKSSAMKILVPTSKLVNMKFVYNCIQVNQVRNDTHKRYWISVYAKKKILLPSLVEQNAILSKTEELFSDLDNGIANFKKAQEQLKIYRQAVLKKAFEGELTKEWREKQTNLPTAEELLKQIKQERQNHYNQQMEDWKKAVKEWEKKGKKYRKPIKPVKLTEIDNGIEFGSTHWLMIELGTIAELIDPQPSHRTPPIQENGIPFISTANFNKETGEIDFVKARKVSKEVLNDQMSLFNLIEGDFIVGKIGTVGMPFIIPSKRFFTLSANLVLVQPNRKICSSKYLLNLVKSNFIQSQFRKGTNSTTQAAFGIQKFRLLRIPLPSLEEQTQIVQEIESRLSVCDKMEQSINESIAKAEALRQSILKKAFEGKLLSKAEIELCKKETDYEPASELLKKIQAEKLAKEQKKKKKPSVKKKSKQ